MTGSCLQIGVEAMDMLVVQGGCPLRGDVYVDGAKNAALPVMAASILLAGDVRIKRVPDLVDVQTMSLLLQSLGAEVRRSDDTLDIDTRGVASSMRTTSWSVECVPASAFSVRCWRDLAVRRCLYRAVATSAIAR